VGIGFTFRSLTVHVRPGGTLRVRGNRWDSLSRNSTTLRQQESLMCPNRRVGSTMSRRYWQKRSYKWSIVMQTGTRAIAICPRRKRKHGKKLNAETVSVGYGNLLPSREPAPLQIRACYCLRACPTTGRSLEVVQDDVCVRPVARGSAAFTVKHASQAASARLPRSTSVGTTTGPHFHNRLRRLWKKRLQDWTRIGPFNQPQPRIHPAPTRLSIVVAMAARAPKPLTHRILWRAGACAHPCCTLHGLRHFSRPS
jgi:hypothetical protein